METSNIITLTTDFGAESPYVAAMKGVILTINPGVRIVDLSHGVPPQQIGDGAIVLDEIAPLFPPATIHVAVVDPGVGTSREIVYVELGEHRYVCPDNGLLGRLASRQSVSKIRAITNRRWFRHPMSATFHGRDIMAPAAAHLSQGLDPAELGPARAGLEPLSWPGASKVAENRIEGQVAAVDSFGNLVTNISREMLEDVPRDETVSVTCDEHETRGIFTTYADQPAMTLLALIGSNDRLELAIVDDSAAIMLGVGTGETVVVRW